MGKETVVTIGKHKMKRGAERKWKWWSVQDQVRRRASESAQRWAPGRSQSL